MTPYYDHAGVTIYLGSCEDVIEQWEGLRTKSFDLLLTDPPYGINRDGMRASTSRHGGRKAYDFKGWDAERPTSETFARLKGITTHQIVWGGNYFVRSLEPSMKWLVWDKGQRIAQSDGELAYTSLPGAMRILTLNRSELQRDGAVHPTQKPEALMRWCLRQAGTPKSVIDPFMGSGSTLVAAKRLGVRAVGIERDEAFCAIAVRRLSQDALVFDAPDDAGLGTYKAATLMDGIERGHQKDGSI